MRQAAMAAAGLRGAALAVVLSLAALAGCGPPQTAGQPPAGITVPPGPGPAFTPVRFDQIPGWRTDRTAEAIPAFLAGCARLDGTDPKLADLCTQARSLPPGNDAAARAFFEAGFVPHVASNDGSMQGLVTGYYEPEFRAARQRGGEYQTPLHRRPPAAGAAPVSIPSPRATTTRAATTRATSGRATRVPSGRAPAGRATPTTVPATTTAMPTRAQIVRGALARRGLEMLWVADPLDAFFLQIQGSGRAILPDGSVVRVTYDGQNGHTYVPIGRVLVDRGEMTIDQVSMQSIRAWLQAHPREAGAVMDQNPSYVFFREVLGMAQEEGPPGAMRAPLTPGRSVAVDRSQIPLGLPVYLDTNDALQPATPWRRLMMAQDVGGAIRGPVRADIFFGWGPDAEERAGRMRQPGSLYVLRPR